MKFSFFSSNSLVGIDIQSDYVRLIQLVKIKQGFLIERFAAYSLPTGVFAEGKVKQWDVLSSLLSEWVHLWGLKNQPVALTLSAHLVRMQRMQVPVGLPPREIEAEIRAQLTRDFPGMTDALAIDYTESMRQAGYSDLLFVATRQEYLLQYVNCIKAAGLNVKIVDVDIYALKRAVSFDLSQSVSVNENVALLYTTHRSILLVMFNQYEILFYQQWEKKETHDFLVEFKNRLQIFYATIGNVRIHRLIVCAMAAYLTWLPQALAELWEGEVCYPQLFRHFQYAPTIDAQFLAQQASDFLIACGAAMREIPRW